MTVDQSQKPPRERSAGIVLPMVLVFVLVFAAIAMIGVRASRSGQALVLMQQQDIAAERALMTTESRTLFLWLTAQPLLGGITLSEDAKFNALSLQDGLKAPSDDSNFWSARGGMRLDSTGIVVRYQDTGGLISLNSNIEPEIRVLLEAFDQSGNDAARLEARLLDYTDANNNRRFLGAEAPAYRLLNRPAPSQSPLRSAMEAQNILGWDEVPVLWHNERLITVTTTDTRSIGLVTGLIAPEVRALLTDKVIEEELNESSTMFGRRQASPTARARFSFYAPVTGPSGARLIERIIEVERRAIAPDRPFYRFFIGERRQPQDYNDASTITEPLIPSGT
ncbi:hypothetical protein GCM10007972_11010 [Iodidimonas muriae]|uniref:Type II secretion system protein K n=1 Tax=Iodidimonas muriae TaxID=261467 RepID=A0ABQ2LC18_9PROT|nr:general secretion pathway protein GspK [Iodidimonas muriae]GER06919.1 hypothetical protein JCM17843_12290 [Kordiimonadales bacterium JCM 17843]GGO09462.1 hypothetical protein GCM10007972_11010 [Iodidimonas muriae]